MRRLGALDAPPVPIGALVAVEGNYLGRVSAIGVGSVRQRVTVTGPGGHAWEAPGMPSAVHAVADLVAEIAAMPASDGTSVNVGRIGGGEGINVRARDRGSSWTCGRTTPIEARPRWRATWTRSSRRSATRSASNGWCSATGRRAGSTLCIRWSVRRATLARGRDRGQPVATSTDANAAHARGIPAIAVGITTGSGEHTPQEWIDTAPIPDGVRTLARTVARYEELSA